MAYGDSTYGASLYGGGPPPSPPIPEAVYIEVAFDSDPFSASPVWTDITNYVLELDATGGKRSDLEQMEGVVCRLRLNNKDRRFDPGHTAGPYYGKLTEMRRLRARVTVLPDTFTFFDGFVTEWPQSWTGRNEVAIAAIDGVGWLAMAETTPGAVVPSDSTGPWISDVLDDVGWPVTRRSLDTGWSVQMAATAGDEQTALAMIEPAVNTEYGVFWQKMTGELSLLHRRRFQTVASSGTFGNTGAVGELPIVAAEHTGPSGRVKNDIRISRLGVVSRATDATSIAKNTRRSFSRDSNAANPNEPWDQANYILSRQKDPPAIISSITVAPDLDIGLWPHVFSREFGDRIFVQVIPPPGVGSALTQHSSIVSRELTWEEGTGRVTCKWGLDRVDTDNPTYWVLGDATLGVLGTTTKLAY